MSLEEITQGSLSMRNALENYLRQYDIQPYRDIGEIDDFTSLKHEQCLSVKATDIKIWHFLVKEFCRFLDQNHHNENNRNGCQSETQNNYLNYSENVSTQVSIMDETSDIYYSPCIPEITTNSLKLKNPSREIQADVYDVYPTKPTEDMKALEGKNLKEYPDLNNPVRLCDDNGNIVLFKLDEGRKQLSTFSTLRRSSQSQARIPSHPIILPWKLRGICLNIDLIFEKEGALIEIFLLDTECNRQKPLPYVFQVKIFSEKDDKELMSAKLVKLVELNKFAEGPEIRLKVKPRTGLRFKFSLCHDID